MEEVKNDITILGAGLVGSLLAILLQKQGFQVTIYEKRPDPRKTDLYAGRSINLALSLRGLRALEAAGLRDAINGLVIPMSGRKMHDMQGEITYQPYGQQGQNINSISRGQLNTLLVKEAEAAGVNVLFEHPCLQAIPEKAMAVIGEGEGHISVESNLLIGADGAFSALRQSFMKMDRFSYAQHYIEHGYKELSILPIDGEFALDPHALHIWPRGNFMLIALPNQDKSFTCTLFFPFEGKVSFASLDSDEKVGAFFDEYFKDAKALIPDLIHQYNTNPTSSLVTIKCYPWACGNSILLGDASHAIVPFYGQGMNAGFEDCFLFMETAREYNYEWQRVLTVFQAMRKPDADAISDLAMQNFVEMRDKVADPAFLAQKKIESKLHMAYPEEWIPQYSMVTFSHTPYHIALQNGNEQNKLVQKHLNEAVIDDPDKADLEQIITDFRSIRKV